MNIHLSQARQVLGRSDLCTFEEAVEYVKKNFGYSYDMWRLIFNRIDFHEYISKTLSIDDAIAYAKKMENTIDSSHETWKVVLNRKDTQEYLLRTLSPMEAITYAKNSYHHQVWHVVIKRDDVVKFLFTDLSPANAIAYAKSIENHYVWGIIMKRTDISPRELIACAVGVKKYECSIWDILFKRADMQEFLLETLSPLEVVMYAAEVNYFRVWGFILDKRKDLPIRELALAYAKRGAQPGYGGDSDYWWQIDKYPTFPLRVYLLETLSPTDALDFATEVNSWKVWEIMIAAKRVSSEDAFAHAKRINHKDVWKVAYERDDISKADIVAYAKELDDPQLWKVILGEK